MNATEAKHIFEKNVRGINVMTPRIEGFGYCNESLVYEKSEGIGMLGEKLFAVTTLVFDGDSWFKCKPASEVFTRREDRDEFIKEIKRRHKAGEFVGDPKNVVSL